MNVTRVRPMISGHTYTRSIRLYRGTPQYKGVSTESYEAIRRVVASRMVVECKACDGKDVIPRKWDLKDLLILPGGKCTEWDGILSVHQLEDLFDWFKKGGRIWGICAGSYYCSKESRYMDLFRLRKVSIFSGICQGPALSEELRVVRVRWERNQSQGYVVMIGGGVFKPKKTKTNKCEVLATLLDTNQTVVVKCQKKEGMGILSSLHWEFDSEDLDDLKMGFPQRVAEIEEMQKLLNEGLEFRKNCVSEMLTELLN